MLVVSDFERPESSSPSHFGLRGTINLRAAVRNSCVILDYNHLLPLDLYTQRSNIHEFIDCIFLSLKRATVCQERVAGSNR